MRTILLLFMAASAAKGQKTLSGTANWTVVTSDAAPNPNTCLGVQNVGNIYVRSQNVNNAPIGVFRCTQGPGQQFIWQPIGHMSMPALTPTCATGDLMFVTGGAGGNLYGCTANNRWVLQSIPSVASLATGSYCMNVVNGVAIGWTACSSGPTTDLQWSLLTSGQWAALTSSQWASLLP